jgi:signal transduction histidine kinase
VFVSSRDITDLKRAEDVLMEQSARQAREEELKRSRKRIVNVQESLRKEIAGQLHGTVQNRLIVILHRLAELEQQATEEKFAMELKDLNIKIKNLIEKDVRLISHRLYPSILRQGLIPALQSLGDQVEAELNIEIDLDKSLMQREIDNRKLISDSLKLAIYRIVEEALVNTVKHANASIVSIKLELSHRGRLKLTIQDNGQGFDKTNTITGVGIAIMQDYAEMTDGKCTIQSTSGKGTKVTAIFPFAEPYAERSEKDFLLE